MNVLLAGPEGMLPGRFIVDTGTPRTIVDATVMSDLGYTSDAGKGRANLLGAGGALPGYIVDIEHLETMGLVFRRFEVVCQPLPRELGVDGLIGMDLLDGRVLTVDCQRGLITLAP